MERSRLPLPSLLGLFGALLMLSPELLMGIAGKIFNPPVTDRGVQEALAFVVQQYNKGKGGSTNYYKLLYLLKVVREVDVLDKYHLTVLMVETICKKRRGMKIIYQNIQKCPLFPVNPKKLTCYFRAFKQKWPMKLMNLSVNSCTPTVLPKDLFCSGNGF